MDSVLKQSMIKRDVLPALVAFAATLPVRHVG